MPFNKGVMKHRSERNLLPILAVRSNMLFNDNSRYGRSIIGRRGGFSRSFTQSPVLPRSLLDSDGFTQVNN